MKIKTRWMDAIKQEAATMTAAMPWERGQRRQDMIRRRSGTTGPSLAAAGLSA